MTRFFPTLLIACAASAGSANAQTSRYYGTQDDYYGGSRGAYSQPVHDYARVLRVDPVIDSNYGARNVRSTQNCRYRRSDEVYAGDDYHGGRYGDERDRGAADGYGDHGYYEPEYGSPRTGSETGSALATVIGGIAGAVLGSKIGEGSGQYVATAVGSMVGGIAGRSIYESTQRGRPPARRGTVRVCDPLPVGAGGYYQGNERLSGYEVTYEYAGRTYRTRTDHHPGNRLRVRVDVQPER